MNGNIYGLLFIFNVCIWKNAGSCLNLMSVTVCTVAVHRSVRPSAHFYKLLERIKLYLVDSFLKNQF